MMFTMFSPASRTLFHFSKEFGVYWAFACSSETEKTGETVPDSSEHAVSNEQDIVESQRIEYIYIPVDFKAPGRADLTRFSEALDRLSDSKIHIHCAANYRVSAFYSLYAAGRGRWSTDQATDFIHSVWRPADYPGWSEFIDEILGELQ